MVWELEERKAVGGIPIVTEPGEELPPAPEVPPITPAPPEGIGLKPAAVPVTPTGFLEEHKKIKSIIDKRGYRYLCTKPSKIADDSGLPLDVVLEHLKVMELDESAKFMETGEDALICGIDALQRLVENLRKLKV